MTKIANSVPHGLRHGYYARQLGQTPWSASVPSTPVPAKGTVAVAPTVPTIPPGAPAICLNEQQNSISCLDPNCAHGDCGSTGPQITVGALCLDQQENQIDCTDPNCTWGDCMSTSWWSKSTIITGIPDIAIYGLLGAIVLVGGRR